MGHTYFRAGVLVIGAALFLASNTGCSSSDNPLAPTAEEIRNIANDTTIVYASSNVRVISAPDSFAPGASVDLGVVLNPANLPIQARTPTIHTKVASVVLADTTDSGTSIFSPLSVRIPLLNKDELDNNTSLGVFMFDDLTGRWVATGRQASIADTTNFATFTAESFATYGLFRVERLRVSVDPTRTTGRAPFSVGLGATIKGGTPPYSVIWYFGDDSDPDVGESVAHIYKDPLTYHAVVSVIDANQQVTTSFVDLRVY